MVAIKSIEEKVKAYDEALKVLHKYDGAHIMFTQDLKEEMFPELKENRDERIKKALIHLVRVKGEEFGFIDANTSVKDAITWLEKQGEPKPVCKMQVSDELYEHIRNTCACIDDALSSKSFADINDYLSMAERSAQSAFDMIEKQSGQKPADKIEPKFKKD